MTAPITSRCRRCDGLLDKNVDRRDPDLHAFCAWATGYDIAALSPYLRADFGTVQVSGG